VPTITPAVETEQRALRLELKADGTEGEFSATFSTLNVVDHHGDVTRPGAFADGAEVFVGAYMHDIWQLPVGKGVIASDDERAWIEGAFWLDTPNGEATYRTVKNAGGLMEWSYIFTVERASYGTHEQGGVKHEEVRFLEQVDVWSVDPVLRGAGIDTRTDGIKSRGGPFAAHALQLAAAAEGFLGRLETRLAMRASEGRELSAVDRERLEALDTGLVELRALIERALRAGARDDQVDIERELLRFQRSLAAGSGALAA